MPEGESLQRTRQPLPLPSERGRDDILENSSNSPPGILGVTKDYRATLNTCPKINSPISQ